MTIRRFTVAAFSFFSFSIAGAVACSSSSTNTTPPESDACTTLADCCAKLTGAQQTTCQSTVDGIKQSGQTSACSPALETYQGSGLCGGAGFDAGVPSCLRTNSCPPDAAIADGGSQGRLDAGSGEQCTQTGACSNGIPYFTCTKTVGSACAADVVFEDGTEFPCESCLNCAAASANASSSCAATTLPVDAGPDCGTPPVLHPETAAGVYCPFSAAGAIHCNAGQECCEVPIAAVGATSTCQAIGAACPVTGSLAWGCNGPLDCAGSASGAECCAQGSVEHDTTCGFDRGTGFTGSHCATSCSAGEVPICGAQSDCASGTCTPFKVTGVVLGACQ